MNYFEVGDNIARIRVQQGLSQDELAELAGIHRVTLARYESGRVDPGAQHLGRIAEALGVTTDTLMGLDRKSEQNPNIEIQSVEAKILAKGIDMLPKEQREQALNVMRAMFVKYAKFFEEDGKDDET